MTEQETQEKSVSERMDTETGFRTRNVRISLDADITIPDDLLDDYIENYDGEIPRTDAAERLADSVAKQRCRQRFDTLGTPTVGIVNRYDYPDRTQFNVVIKQ